MNSKLSQEQKNKFKIGDLVCYKRSASNKMCGIITDIKKELVKIYWCINKEDVDISPLSYPPVRKDGWIAAGILKSSGNLEIILTKM